MRAAAEGDIWSALKKRANTEVVEFAVGPESSIDLSQPCIVLGGRNGSGKSRVLRALEEHLGEKALRIDLHHLSEHALAVLRYRTDVDGLIEEATDQSISAERLDDVQRIVGRVYDEVEWFAIDVEFGDETLEPVRNTFRWGGDQILIPYFKAKYGGLEFDARTMGLGEFSVHFLFWILEQYKDRVELTLLLDEPDAYLPPVGVSPLLTRVLHLCDERGWNLVIATHSEELIAESSRRKLFHLLRTDSSGHIQALTSADDPDVGTHLLARPAHKYLAFVEDESAWHLARALLNVADRPLSREVLLVWGNGWSFMTSMRPYLPKPPHAEVKFAYIFDGDQRGKVPPSAQSEWRAIFLPTQADPDELMKDLRNDAESLARSFSTPVAELERFLDSIEGHDPHDWVNAIGVEFERQRALRTLTALWAASHAAEATAFATDIQKL